MGTTGTPPQGGGRRGMGTGRRFSRDSLVAKHSPPVLFFCFWGLIWKMRLTREKKLAPGFVLDGGCIVVWFGFS